MTDKVPRMWPRTAAAQPGRRSSRKSDATIHLPTAVACIEASLSPRILAMDSGVERIAMLAASLAATAYVVPASTGGAAV